MAFNANSSTTMTLGGAKQKIWPVGRGHCWSGMAWSLMVLLLFFLYLPLVSCLLCSLDLLQHFLSCPEISTRSDSSSHRCFHRGLVPRVLFHAAWLGPAFWPLSLLFYKEGGTRCDTHMLLSGRGRTRSRASDTSHWAALPRINVYSASLVLLELPGSVFGISYLFVSHSNSKR